MVLGRCGKQQNVFVVRSLQEEFQTVLDAFKRNFEKRLETGAQFVVYHRGKKVIDITGSNRTLTKKGYSPDSVQMVFSSGKTVASLAIALLVCQGKLDYDKPVADYWPEFAANGKESIRLKDVLRHDAGLAYCSQKVTTKMLLERPRTTVTRIIEESEPAWMYKKGVNEGSRIYHMASRGVILDEICRRVDEQQRSIGQLLLEELNARISNVHSTETDEIFMFCGKRNIPHGNLQEIYEKRYIKYRFESISYAIWKKLAHSLKYSFREDPSLRFRKSLPQELLDSEKQLKKETKEQKLKSQAWTAGKMFSIGNPFKPSDSTIEMETPSVTLVANANALAAFGDACFFAEKSKRILDDQTIEKFFSEPSTKMDLETMTGWTFTKGGVCDFRDAMYPQYLHSFHGWQGYGGSCFAFSREYEISVAYVPNRYNVLSFGGFLDPRCLNLMEALMKVFESSTSKLSPDTN